MIVVVLQRQQLNTNLFNVRTASVYTFLSTMSIFADRLLSEFDFHCSSSANYYFSDVNVHQFTTNIGAAALSNSFGAALRVDSKIKAVQFLFYPGLI